MEGIPGIQDHNGKVPSHDRNQTLAALQDVGDSPCPSSLTLATGDILGELGQGNTTDGLQNGDLSDSQGKCNVTHIDTGDSNVSVVRCDNQDSSVSEVTVHGLPGSEILDLSSNAFASLPVGNFDSEFFGSPDRDFFDGGERSRSYPPSPTAPRTSSSTKTDSDPLNVFNTDSGFPGLKKGLSFNQLPSYWLESLDLHGREFQTTRLQDVTSRRDEEIIYPVSASLIKEQSEDDREDDTLTSLDKSTKLMVPSLQLDIDGNTSVGHLIDNGHVKTPEVDQSVADMVPFSDKTQEQVDIPMLGDDGPNVTSAQCSRDADDNDLGSSELARRTRIINLCGGSKYPTDLVFNVEAGPTSDMVERSMSSEPLIYVITSKDQATGEVSSFRLTVDPDAIQSVPVDSLALNSVDGTGAVEQTLEQGGSGIPITSKAKDLGILNAVPGAISVATPEVLQANCIINTALLTNALKEEAKNRKRKNSWLKNNEPKPSVCTEEGCGLEFSSKTKFKAHQSMHLKNRPFKCDYEGCEWSFESNTKLRRHLLSHEGTKSYMCTHDGCNKCFLSAFNLRVHMRIHTNSDSIRCEVEGCTETFSTQKKLEIHLREHFEDQRLKCPVPGCEATFLTANARGSHLRRHSKKERFFRCPFFNCEKVFEKQSRLEYHIRSHTGERPFKCEAPGCEWAFTSLQKLKRHTTRHTGEKQFVCEVEGCMKSFTRREHLQAHNVAHSGQLPFECKEPGCNARFSQRSSLYMHKKRHKQGKPMREKLLFSCPLDVCNLSFSSKLGLKNHIVKGHGIPLPMTDAGGGDMVDLEFVIQPNITSTAASMTSSSAFAALQKAASAVVASASHTSPDAAADVQSILQLNKDIPIYVADPLPSITSDPHGSIHVQLNEAVQQITDAAKEAETSAVNLLSVINLAQSRTKLDVPHTSARTDFAVVSKKVALFPSLVADSGMKRGVLQDHDIIEDMDVGPPNVTSIPNSFIPTSGLGPTSPLTLRDPTTGVHFIQTQLLQDDPPDDSDIPFQLVSQATSSPSQSSLHSVLPVSALLGDGDHCPVTAATDFLTSDTSFGESTINLQDLE